MKSVYYIAMVLTVFFIGVQESQAAIEHKLLEVARCELTENTGFEVTTTFDPKRVETEDSITSLLKAPNSKYTVKVVNTDAEHSIFITVPDFGRVELFPGKTWERRDLTYKKKVTFVLQKEAVETEYRNSFFCVPCITTGFEDLGTGTLTVYKQD